MARISRPLVSIALLAMLVGCSTEPAPRAPNACIPDAAGSAWTLDDATAPGPFAVGTHDETFVDDTRSTPAHGTFAGAPTRTLVTSMWYPATAAGADTPVASGGPFPVVLYSHGFMSTRKENPRLAAHLASHGYIVIAPAFPVSNIAAEGGASGVDIAEQPGDLSFLLDQAIAMSTTSGSWLEGAVDAERVAAAGLSLGGLTTLLVTFHPDLRDPRIDVAAAMAPVSGILLGSIYDTTDAPFMVMFGDADAILGYTPNATNVRDRARAPMNLFTLSRGSHSGFISLALLYEGLQGYEHIDKMGCDGLGGSGGSGPDLQSMVDLLGGPSKGVDVCDSWAFCPADLGVSMLPSRQLLLENAAVRAQLDSYLSNDDTTRRRACHFAEQVLPNEADLDLFRR